VEPLFQRSNRRIVETVHELLIDSDWLSSPCLTRKRPEMRMETIGYLGELSPGLGIQSDRLEPFPMVRADALYLHVKMKRDRDIRRFGRELNEVRRNGGHLE
jgi:hypothetical protein